MNVINTNNNNSNTNTNRNNKRTKKSPDLYIIKKSKYLKSLPKQRYESLKLVEEKKAELLINQVLGVDKFKRDYSLFGPIKFSESRKKNHPEKREISKKNIKSNLLITSVEESIQTGNIMNNSKNVMINNNISFNKEKKEGNNILSKAGEDIVSCGSTNRERINNKSKDKDKIKKIDTNVKTTKEIFDLVKKIKYDM